MLKELFTWKGRLGRLRYFLYSLASLLLIGLGFVPVALEIGYLQVPGTDPSACAILFIVAGFGVAMWIGIVTLIRRLHDLNLSGWWLFATFLSSLFAGSPSLIVQIIAGLFSLGWGVYLTCVAGTPGDNRFGPARGKRVNADQAASAGSYA
jgi:uncharacterized membrane protein YhaH (DUF805 family)